MTSAEQQATNATLDAFFEKYRGGDLPGMIELFADSVDFRVNGSPNVPWTGTRSTKAEISEFFEIFPKVLTAPEKVSFNARIVDGQNAVVTADVVFGVVATGKKFSNSYAVHFSVVDGKITRYHMYEDSYAIAEAFAE